MANRIVIFGPYKTGTTGLFYRIRDSLSGNVRTLFESNEYVPEEGDAYRWILAKTMLTLASPVKYDTFMDFDKQIYIVRDPRDWLVSGTLFIIQQDDSIYADENKFSEILAILTQKERNPSSISLLGILEEIMRRSNQHSFDRILSAIAQQYRWLPVFETQLGDYFLLKYEHFVDGRIKGLEKYLGIPLGGEGKVDRVHDHVIRTKGYGDWRNWFAAEDIDYFKPVFDEYIKLYGYSDDWRLNDRQIIRPEFCTKYVERVVSKRRNSSPHVL